MQYKGYEFGDDELYRDDPRFAIKNNIETEITPYATPQVIENPFQEFKIEKSKRFPYRLHTTSLCYDDAWDFLEGIEKHHAMLNKSTKHWLLCHGILTGLAKEDKEAWGHAWLERAGVIYDARYLKGERVFTMTSKDEWYQTWMPQYVVQYDFKEARQQMNASPTGNAGAWDRKILELTKNHYQQYDQVFVVQKKK